MQPRIPQNPEGPFIRVWKPLSVSPFVSESNQLNRKGVFCLRTILLLTHNPYNYYTLEITV